MGVLGIFALIVQIVLVLCMLGAWVAVAMLPGRIARDRGHPQADAVNVCGWFGALTMGLLAPVAFIWAYWRPTGQAVAAEPSAAPQAPAASREEA